MFYRLDNAFVQLDDDPGIALEKADVLDDGW